MRRATTAFIPFLILMGIVFSMAAASDRTEHATDGAEATKPKMRSATFVKDGLRLTVTCEAEMISGAANYVTFLVENVGKRDVEYTPYTHIPAINLKVSRKDEPVALLGWARARLEVDPPEGWVDMRKKHRPISLDPGRKVRVVLNLSRYVDLSVPGDYKIIGSWKGKVVGTDEAIELETKPIDFEVVIGPGETSNVGPEPEDDEDVGGKALEE